MAILCCCFISSSSVSSSCLLCRRCKLSSLDKEKSLAKQSSHQFLILYLLLLCTFFHSNGLPLPLKAPFLFSSTLYLSRTSSSILSTIFIQHGSISLEFSLLQLFISSVSPPQRCSAFPSFLQWTILALSSLLWIVHPLALWHSFIYHQLRCFSYDIQLPGSCLPFFFFQSSHQNVAPLPIVLPFGRLLASFPFLLHSQSASNPIFVWGFALQSFLSLFQQSSKAIL